MNYHTTREEAQAVRSSRDRIAGLIAEYPGVSDAERREILLFLRTARHLDVGLLTAEDRLKPNLDAFMKDHRAHFRLGVLEATAVTAGLIALFVIFWLVAQAFA